MVPLKKALAQTPTKLRLSNRAALHRGAVAHI